MKNFFIADLHLGHERIIPMCNRPFKDGIDMTNKIVEKWNKKVTDKDTVYILGDLSFKMKKEEVIEILKQLKGKKILIKGNHDTFVGQRDFDECFEGIYDMFQLRENQLQITLCHYPIIDFPGMYYGAIMIYGHVHNKYVPHKNMYCVSVECINYEPVTFDELIEIYKNKIIEEEVDWTLKWKENN